MARVITETDAVDKHAIDIALAVCFLSVSGEIRHVGFAPVQWVLAECIRQLATLGAEHECADVGATQTHLLRVRLPSYCSPSAGKATNEL